MIYPLRFEPILRQYLWGGRRLETVLGKTLGSGDKYAESWEVVDHGDDQSVVRFGPLAGKTLRELVKDHGPSLFGRHDPQARFPLLFKFLDAQRDLSVQVHPNDDQAARLDPPDLGKTEAWVILDAQPGSKIYCGLKPGVDRSDLADAVAQGTTESCLHQIHPAVGDCLFIPAGTVHALGAGLLVAEIQQASDTTFRLFDWNRVGDDGKPRPLHIDEALRVIEFDAGPVNCQQPVPTEDPARSELVRCEKFVLDRWSIDKPVALPDVSSFHLLAVLSGSIAVEQDAADRPLAMGSSLLIPASAAGLSMIPREPSVVLDVYLP
jgi:mannose-6-phosphate isomerase